jgi:phage regulator Rha-like protein
MRKQIEQTLDSREVAEMLGKEHKNLLADIRGYLEELSLLKSEESDSRLKIQPSDFFQKK